LFPEESIQKSGNQNNLLSVLKGTQSTNTRVLKLL